MSRHEGEEPGTGEQRKGERAEKSFPGLLRADVWHERVAPDQFAQWLDEFLGKLPTEGEYAVEIRNEDFLGPAYFAVLREHGVAHVFNSWTRMPEIGAQLDRPGSLTARFLVARALLKTGQSYSEAVDQFVAARGLRIEKLPHYNVPAFVRKPVAGR